MMSFTSSGELIPLNLQFKSEKGIEMTDHYLLYSELN